jgi:hypothetical protein
LNLHIAAVALNVAIFRAALAVQEGWIVLRFIIQIQIQGIQTAREVMKM